MARKRINWGSVAHRLGKEPDSSIARDLGVTQSAVVLARRARGIDACRGRVVNERKRWTNDDIQLVGTDTDRNVALKLKRSTRSVQYKRNELEIPHYTDTNLRYVTAWLRDKRAVNALKKLERKHGSIRAAIEQALIEADD